MWNSLEGENKIHHSTKYHVLYPIKITTQIKKQKNKTHTQRKNQFIETHPEMAEVMEITDKNL